MSSINTIYGYSTACVCVCMTAHVCVCVRMCVGVSGEQIDKLVHEYLVANGAYPAGVNFHGFPKAVCMSVNEGVCVCVCV